MEHVEPARILVVEDDRKAAALLARGLGEEGFQVDVVHSAEEAEAAIGAAGHDLLVVDWMLPGKDGAALCHDLRSRRVSTPVLMLTARDALEDRVAGLNLGADDYLTKPFAYEELLARVRALLRRTELARPTPLELADLRVDPTRQQAWRGVARLDLTRKEYAILEILIRRAGEVVTRTLIIDEVWKSDLIGIDNLLDAHMHNLRRKVDLPGLAPLIHTVRGRGFRLEAGSA
ncbi:MAG TPA: response regulator transcription factor [Burkholderiaceae bacterium]|nr:response regulator transcription factor [Burkholderiaceae bacterium]